MTAAEPLWGVHDKEAVLSPCALYRYRLTRTWDPACWRLPFVMLNPSTADATVDDPTIRRCMGFARRDGYGGIVVLNLYAWRSTDPKVLSRLVDPVGPDNDRHLAEVLAACAIRGGSVVAAWGTHAAARRGAEVLTLVPGVDWRCLGTTAHGHPRHPLYVRGDQPLVPFGRSL